MSIKDWLFRQKDQLQELKESVDGLKQVEGECRNAIADLRDAGADMDTLYPYMERVTKLGADRSKFEASIKLFEEQRKMAQAVQDQQTATALMTASRLSRPIMTASNLRPGGIIGSTGSVSGSGQCEVCKRVRASRDLTSMLVASPGRHGNPGKDQIIIHCADTEQCHQRAYAKLLERYPDSAERIIRRS